MEFPQRGYGPSPKSETSLVEHGGGGAEKEDLITEGLQSEKRGGEPKK